MFSVPSLNPLAFQPVTFSPADPAAGASLAFFPPANSVFLLDAVYCLLITSAAAANRRIHLYIAVSAGLIYDFMSSDIITASQARRVNIYPSAQFYTSGGADGRCLLPIPPNLYMQENDQIIVEVSAMDPADQLSDFNFQGRLWAVL